MTTLEQRGVVRLRYRRRQLLAGDDLRREVADPTELQWWHNRSLHDGFGVVRGLDVSFVGTAGETLVGITPGLAYDAYGRSLALDRPVAVTLPDGRPDGLLLLRTPRADPWAATRPGAPATSAQVPEICWAGGHVAAREGVPLACLTRVELATLPDLGGTLPGRIAYLPDKGMLVAIGRLPVADRDAALALSSDGMYQQVVRDLWDAGRSCPWPRRARRIARPRVVSGMTIPGQTPWQPWTLKYPAVVADRRQFIDIPIGFQVRIDTSAAGFAELPCYFAWLQGPLVDLPIPGKQSLSVGAHWDHVDEAGPGAFTFRTSPLTQAIVSAQRAGRDPWMRPLAGLASDVLRVLRDREFSVSWLAVAVDADAADDGGDPSSATLNEVTDGHVQ